MRLGLRPPYSSNSKRDAIFRAISLLFPTRAANARRLRRHSLIREFSARVCAQLLTRRRIIVIEETVFALVAITKLLASQVDSSELNHERIAKCQLEETARSRYP